MKTGIELIAEERQRQVEKWTKEHDNQPKCGELSDTAVCYAMRGYWRRRISIIEIFPFDMKWWKPTPDDRIKELQKAGALIAAEIDRLQYLN